MTVAYTTNHTISVAASPAPGRCVELRNPTGSGYKIELQMFACASLADSARWQIERFTGLCSHGSSPAPEQADVYKSDPSGVAFAGEVWTGEGSALNWSGLTKDFEYDFPLDPKGAGDDAQWIPNIYQGTPIVLPPGCSIALTPPEGEADYKVQFHCTQVAV